jgi:transposase
MLAASQKAVADQLRLSWDEVHAIQERAVKRGLQRRKAEPITRLGVDEKSFTRGHRYFTLVNDLARSRVLFVTENRTTESLDEFDLMPAKIPECLFFQCSGYVSTASKKRG